MKAVVLEPIRVTPTAPDTPTKPAPPATTRFSVFSVDCAWTTTPCALVVPNEVPLLTPFSTPARPVPAALASTWAPSPMKARVSLWITVTPTEAPTPTKPPASAPEITVIWLSSVA